MARIRLSPSLARIIHERAPSPYFAPSVDELSMVFFDVGRGRRFRQYVTVGNIKPGRTEQLEGLLEARQCLALITNDDGEANIQRVMLE